MAESRTTRRRTEPAPPPVEAPEPVEPVDPALGPEEPMEVPPAAVEVMAADWDPDYLHVRHKEGCPEDERVESPEPREGAVRMESYRTVEAARELDDGTVIPRRQVKVVRCIECGEAAKVYPVPLAGT